MEKIDAKVIMFALLPVLLLQFSRLVGAVDVVLFSNPGGCNQPGRACLNIAPAVICCPAGNLGFASVYITNAFDNTISEFFTRGSTDCSIFAGMGAPGNNVCSSSPSNGPLYTGALWAPGSSRRRSLLDLDFMTSVGTKFMEPNAVVFTEDGTTHWTLPTSEANDLYSQMINVADAEKADWLKSKGATYKEL